MEQILVELKPEQLQKIAEAKKVKLQIGSTRFELSDEYMNTIRDFNGRLIPSSQSGATGNAQTQAGQTGTTFDEALSFLSF